MVLKINFMYQTDKMKWSFLAGIFDGEGTLSCWRTKPRAHDYKESGKTYDSFNMRVTIPNTSLKLMKWLITNFGGVYAVKREANEKHKASYEWRPKGEGNTKQFLLGVLPYLVIKDEQAKLGLRYTDLPHKSPKEREEIYIKLSILNQKGPTTLTTNTPNNSYELKIESDLISDNESELVVTQDFQ